MDKPEAITAAIAAFGVIVSVVFSYVTSSRSVKLELRKHQEQIMQDFGKKIFEKRIDCYPKLYSMVCRYARDLKEATMNKTILAQYYQEVSDWDVNHSIYMSAKTQYLFHQFRVELLETSKLSEDGLDEKLKLPAFRKNLRDTSNKVELALKNELGIYSFESPHTINPGTVFETYGEADLHATKNL